MPIIALFLWLLYLIDSRLIIGEYGLIHSMSPSYFIAAAILTLSFFNAINNPENVVPAVIHTFLLILFLYVTPPMLEGTARYLPSYRAYFASEHVARTGHSYGIPVFELWSGFTNFVSTLLLLSEVDGYALMIVFPILSGLLYLPALYTLLKRLVGSDRQVWIAIWVFYFIWFQQQYLLAQNPGFFFLILFMGTFASIIGSSDAKFLKGLVLTLLLVAITMTHGLSTMALIAIIISITIVHLLKYFRSKQGLLVMIIIFAALYVVVNAWFKGIYIFEMWFFVPALGQVLSKIVWSLMWVFVYAPRTARTNIVLIRFLFVMLFVAPVTVGLISTLRSRSNSARRKLILGWLIGALGLVFVTDYLGEILVRVLLFSSIPFAALLARNTSHRVFALYLVPLFFLSPTLHILSHYGNEAIDYIPRMEIAEAEFFIKYSDGSRLAADMLDGVWIIKESGLRRERVITDYDLLTKMQDSYSGYFLISQKDLKGWYHMYGPSIEPFIAPLIRIATYLGSDLVYNSGYSRVYFRP